MTYNINVQLVDWTFPKIVYLATQGADVDVYKIFATTHILKCLIYPNQLLLIVVQSLDIIVFQIDFPCIL